MRIYQERLIKGVLHYISERDAQSSKKSDFSKETGELAFLLLKGSNAKK